MTRRKRPPMPPEERALRKLQNDHRRPIRSAFRAAGFNRVTGFARKTFRFGGSEASFADAFTFENVIVLCDYTVEQNSAPILEARAPIYASVADQTAALRKALVSGFPGFSEQATYPEEDLQIVPVFCTYYGLSSSAKATVPQVKFFEFNIVKYF